MIKFKVIILEIRAEKTVPTIHNFNYNYSKRHKNFKLIRINLVENEVVNIYDIEIRSRGLDIIKKLLKGDINERIT